MWVSLDSRIVLRVSFKAVYFVLYVRYNNSVSHDDVMLFYFSETGSLPCTIVINSPFK